MAWSKRKPYVYDEDAKTPAGRIQSSLGDFFRAQVRHLKESNEKESQFEKPYRGGSYNKMHLDLPWPEFRHYEDPEPGSIFGPMPSLMHTFFFGDGLCSFMGGGELEIGEPKRISGFMSLTPPQTGSGEWIWIVVSSKSEVQVEVLEHGKSPKIEATALSEFSGTALVCAECGYSGLLVDSYTMEKAGAGFVELQLINNQWVFVDRNTNLPVDSFVETTYKEQRNVPCGCVEFTCGTDCETITPVTFLAYGVNPETIPRNNSRVLTVQDGLAPYSWSVSGTGFSIPGVTSGLSNTLSADGTACGVALVTVTDACENSDTYEVRCTIGSWQNYTVGCILEGVAAQYGSGASAVARQGKYKQESGTLICHIGTVDTCTAANGCDVCHCLSGITCAMLNYTGPTLYNGCILHCSYMCIEQKTSDTYYFTWGC